MYGLKPVPFRKFSPEVRFLAGARRKSIPQGLKAEKSVKFMYGLKPVHKLPTRGIAFLRDLKSLTMSRGALSAESGGGNGVRGCCVTVAIDHPGVLPLLALA